MGNGLEKGSLVDAAFGAIVADGCFCLAFMVHLVRAAETGLTLGDYLAGGAIVGVLVAACWLIYYDYWHGRPSGSATVKMLRIKEMKEGAAIEFDGKRYRVDNINRSEGRIHIARVGQPGSIIVEIDGA
jgi:hypothetical protein